MDIAKRIQRIISSSVGKGWEEIEKAVNSGQTSLEQEIDRWEKKLNADKTENNFPENFKTPNPLTQEEIDLSVFQLKPGASWEEIKKAYHRESRKYHTDYFQHDETKQNASKEIMQIYNETYDRLKKKYAKK